MPIAHWQALDLWHEINHLITEGFELSFVLKTIS